MSNSQARVDDILNEAARLFASKNATYQDSWRTQGWRGNLSRILEKSGRLRAMLWRGGNVLLNGSNEHPRETAIDMINTLAFLVINMDDGVEWGHEAQARDIASPLDHELEQFRLSYGDSSLTRADMERIKANPSSFSFDNQELQVEPHPSFVGEQTIVTPHVGEVPTPGEEKPTPRPRRQANVTDRGSGPRQRPNTSAAQA